MLNPTLNKIHFRDMPVGTIFKNSIYINIKISSESRRNTFCITDGTIYNFLINAPSVKYEILESELVIKE